VVPIRVLFKKRQKKKKKARFPPHVMISLAFSLPYPLHPTPPLINLQRAETETKTDTLSFLN